MYLIVSVGGGSSEQIMAIGFSSVAELKFKFTRFHEYNEFALDIVCILRFYVYNYYCFIFNYLLKKG